MTTWKARLPKGLPDRGNAHLVFAIKTETGFRTELVAEVDAYKLLRLYEEAMALEKHKEGDPQAYEEKNNG